MKKEKAFTLIELLAVIVILGIIAVIATPLAINVIEDAKKNSFKNTAYGLIDTVKLQYAENYLNGNTSELFYTFPDTTGLSFSGESPDGGTIRLTSDGKISLAIHNNKWCAVKGLDASDVSIRAYEEGKCILQEEADVPVITLKGKDIMYIGIGKTFTDPGFSVTTVGGEELDNNLVNVKIIGQTTNKEEVDTRIEETYSITYSIEYKGKKDVKTRTVHVGNYDPTIVIEPNGTNEYEKTLDVTISVSAHENFTIDGFTYTIIKDNVEGSPITINELTKVLTLNEDGIYKIKVSATDSNENTSEYASEEFKIDSTITEPNVVATTSPNANGWYKENIAINITTDNDKSEISEIKYCKTENTTCIPDTTITGTSGNTVIDKESATNYVCAFSIDKAGNESAVKCVGPYALDKTAPTLTVPADTTIKVSEVASYNLLNGASVTDSLSEIDGSITTIGNLSSIIQTYTITYAASDKAGNKSSETRKITVKSDSISFTEKMQSSSEVAALDPDGNLRYVGVNPNNYVWFNKELWRIIGVFNGQAKIIRYKDYSGSILWDEDDNNWAASDLKSELNGKYLTSIKNNDVESYDFIDLNHVWNIGAVSNDTETWTRESLYNLERGTNPAAGSGSTNTWTGTIGLMHASDYGYSTGGDKTTCDITIYDWSYYYAYGDYIGNQKAFTECTQKSWLYDNSGEGQWTLTPRSGKSMYVLLVTEDGDILNAKVYTEANYSAKPALYLKTNVKIVDGLGTEQDPFILGTE